MVSFKSLKSSVYIDPFLKFYKDQVYLNDEYLIISFYLSKGNSFIDFGNFD